MTEEIWKDITGYEGLYKISNLGKVKNLDKCNLHDIWINNGYVKVALCKNENRKIYKVSRLVAIHFIPNIEDNPEVDHIDRDRLNNKVSNLRWVSSSENKLNRNVFGSVPYRHISCDKKNKKWIIQIRRNNKLVFQKAFSIYLFELEDVLDYRDTIVYPELGIKIND